jgi:hypothetical protein
MIKQIQEHIEGETTSMSKNTVSSKVNKKICQAFDCSEEIADELMFGRVMGHAFIKSLQRICKKVPGYKSDVKSDPL